MNELQVFTYDQKAIRTVEKEDGLWWVLKDVCDVLSLTNPTVIADRLDEDEVTKFDLGGQSGISNIVNEAGLYNVILRSDKPEAKRFKRWVTHEVLPSIRKHGAYVAPNTALSDTTRQALAEAKLNNSRARLSSVWLKLAQQVNLPEYRQICMSYASGVLAGKPVLPLPEGGQRHYTATEIGKMFGVSARKIGDLAKANGIKCEQFGKWYHDKSPYSAKEVDTFRYNDAAIGQFERLLRGAGKAG